MKRTQKKAGGAKRPQMVEVLTPERTETIVRLTRVLWAEMRRSLRTLHREIADLEEVGGTPVMPGTVRLQIMLGAMQAVEKNQRKTLRCAGSDWHAGEWQREFRRWMQTWLAEFERDLEEWGTRPEGADPHDGTLFTAGFARVLPRLREAYDDWSYVIEQLHANVFGATESEIKRIDVHAEAHPGPNQGSTDGGASRVDAGDAMMFVSTAWNAGFKTYGMASAENLEGLKLKLLESGQQKVHLVSVDAMDDSWSYEKSNIPVEELSEADLAWLNVPQEGRWASQRYLVCRL